MKCRVPCSIAIESGKRTRPTARQIEGAAGDHLSAGLKIKTTDALAGAKVGHEPGVGGAVRVEPDETGRRGRGTAVHKGKLTDHERLSVRLQQERPDRGRPADARMEGRVETTVRANARDRGKVGLPAGKRVRDE